MNIEINLLQYAVSDDLDAPVYYGNTLKPTHTKNQPQVTFDAKKKLYDSQVEISIIYFNDCFV